MLQFDAYDRYQMKMNMRGRSPKERAFKHKQKDFAKYFENTLNKEIAIVVDKDNKQRQVEMAFQDHSQSNNKQLSDDKYIIAKNEDIINVGDYINWRGDDWMVFTKEFKTIPTHQQALIKNANAIIKWIRNGVIINDGKGYPAYIQSQTLYTMGVSETTYIDVVDGKMMMYMQANKDTLNIKQDERVVIGIKVYKIKFMDFVSRQGLVSFLLDEDRIYSEYDNIELGVADYYKYFNKDTDFTDNTQPIDPPSSEVVISGSKSPKVGSLNTYSVNTPIKNWIIEDPNQDYAYTITEKNDTSIKIRFKDDYRFIGSKLTIIVEDMNGNYVKYPIVIAKKF